MWTPLIARVAPLVVQTAEEIADHLR